MDQSCYGRRYFATATTDHMEIKGHTTTANRCLVDLLDGFIVCFFYFPSLFLIHVQPRYCEADADWLFTITQASLPVRLDVRTRT